ncbi:MAG TPA: hypothetical protein VFL93_02520 [Longimicrobiaceae bacterium]|nr:hypothetical protein [Longimicrobiaceae bacterium]
MTNVPVVPRPRPWVERLLPRRSTTTRRTFSRSVGRELETASRRGVPFTIVWLGVDRVGGGESAVVPDLQRTALEIIRAVLRRCDAVHELGGAEFGLILRKMDDESGRREIQRVVDALGRGLAHHECWTRISVGGVTWSGDAVALSELLQRLYQQFFEARGDRERSWHHVVLADERQGPARTSVGTCIHRYPTRAARVGRPMRPAWCIRNRGDCRVPIHPRMRA